MKTMVNAGRRPSGAARAAVVLPAAALFLLLAVLPHAAAEESYLSHRIRATVLVADPDRAAEAVTRWAEEAGGWFLVRSGEGAVVRFPNTQLGVLRGLLEGLAEEVVEFSPEATDLRESLLGLQSGIRSREEILQRNLAYLDGANVKGTLAIEQEVLGLLQEIEALKGKLNRLQVDRRLAVAEISFRFLEQSVPTDLPSSFGWINTVDYPSFMQGGFPGD